MKKLILLFLLTSAFCGMAQTKFKFLALGDSYTIGESVAEHERWPVQYVEALRKRGIDCSPPEIIATTGWRTDELKNAIEKAPLSPPYDRVSLLIGVNNQYQGKTVENYKPEFEALLLTAIRLAGQDPSKVFVVSIPDYGYTPFGREKQPAISAAIDEFNKVNAEVAKQYNVTYYNITEISRRGLAEPDLIANDGLHPSGKMYALWVNAILKN